MNGSFNGQILVEKLAKLNTTQQSIETLSHWCIFHRNKAKQVVETWERQFHCSPREQRVCFLYLANDILQNSRRKGLEFINEFWRVLPGALIDVYGNGGEFGRNAVLRLVDIWEDRKVFGTRGQILKEELLGKKVENKNRMGRLITHKLKQPTAEILEKVIGGYEHVYDVPVDEDGLRGKCQSAISYIENLEKDFRGNTHGSEFAREIQFQHGVLRECMKQLKTLESSRENLIFYLREALHEQEIKNEQVHHQLQAAQSRYDQSSSLFQQLNIDLPPAEQIFKESPSTTFSDMPPGFNPETTMCTEDKAHGTPVRCIQEGPLANNDSSNTDKDHRRTAPSVVGAKLTASTSSLMSYGFSPAADGGAGQPANKEDHPSDNKKLKVENDTLPLLPPVPMYHPPLPPYPFPDMLQQPPAPPPQRPPVTHPSTSVEPPPPPPLPPSLPPVPPPPPPTTSQFIPSMSGQMTPPTTTTQFLPSMPGQITPPPTTTQFMQSMSGQITPPLTTTQFMQTMSGAVTGPPYAYSSPPPPLCPTFTPMRAMPYLGPLNSYPNFQASEGVTPFAQSPIPTAPPSLPPH